MVCVFVCVCACVHACVRACVRACICESSMTISGNRPFVENVGHRDNLVSLCNVLHCKF